MESSEPPKQEGAPEEVSREWLMKKQLIEVAETLRLPIVIPSNTMVNMVL